MCRTYNKSAKTPHLSVLCAVLVIFQYLPTSVNAFSPILSNNIQYHCSFIHASGNLSRHGLTKYRSRQIVVQSTSNDENEDELEVEIARNLSTPTSPDDAEKPLDPLIQALTKMDDETLNAPTIKAPLFGEIPIDGSIVVLVPAALIAVAGFVFSIVIGVQSKDLIADQITQVTEVLSTPPAAKQKIDVNACRGLCSDQTAQLDTMRGFMQKLAKDSPVSNSAPIDPVTTSSDVTQEPPTATQNEPSNSPPIYGTAQPE